MKQGKFYILLKKEGGNAMLEKWWEVVWHLFTGR